MTTHELILDKNNVMQVETTEIFASGPCMMSVGPVGCAPEDMCELGIVEVGPLVTRKKWGGINPAQN